MTAKRLPKRRARMGELLRATERAKIHVLLEHHGLVRTAKMLDVSPTTLRKVFEGQGIGPEPMAHLRHWLPGIPIPAPDATIEVPRNPYVQPDPETSERTRLSLAYCCSARLAAALAVDVGALRTIASGHGRVRSSTLKRVRKGLSTLLTPPFAALAPIMLRGSKAEASALRVEREQAPPLPGLSRVETVALLRGLTG